LDALVGIFIDRVYTFIILIMKTKVYFFFYIICSVLLIACNGGSNKSTPSPAAEIKNIINTDKKLNEGLKKQETEGETTHEGVASIFKAEDFDYVLDFSDTTTYSISCGKINPGQWNVKNDTCCLYTAYIVADVTESVDVDFTFNINQSGNGDSYDRGYVYHSIDGGDWELDTVWVAGGHPAVYEMNTTITLEYGHYVQFMVRLATNDKTEFWAIQDGGIHASDGDDTNNDIHAYDTPPGSDLPVSLVQFTGTTEKGTVILNWSTASEINNDYFVVEKSTDGEMFSELARIDGAGNSNDLLSYEYIDENPSDLNYYRLRQYDFNGTTSCSEIIKVSLPESEKDQVQVTSNQGTIYIMANSTEGGVMKVQIYNLSGAMVFESEYSVEKGSSTHTMIPAITKNVIYIVSTSLNGVVPVNSKIYFE
jgi:hypothetical protein